MCRHLSSNARAGEASWKVLVRVALNQQLKYTYLFKASTLPEASQHGRCFGE